MSTGAPLKKGKRITLVNTGEVGIVTKADRNDVHFTLDDSDGEDFEPPGPCWLDTSDIHAHYSPMSTTNDIPAAAIGEELRRLRKACGMTLKDFARHVSMPWQTLQAYETGRTMPPSDNLLKITHAARRAKEPFRFEAVARAVAQAA